MNLGLIHNIDATARSLSFDYDNAFSKLGYVYYEVLPVSASTPNANHVRFGLDGANTAALCAGKQAIQSRNDTLSFSCSSSLTATVQYNLWVAIDSNKNGAGLTLASPQFRTFTART
jgi:hypothetical protein